MKKVDENSSSTSDISGLSDLDEEEREMVEKIKGKRLE